MSDAGSERATMGVSVFLPMRLATAPSLPCALLVLPCLRSDAPRAIADERCEVHCFDRTKQGLRAVAIRCLIPIALTSALFETPCHH